MFHPGLFFFFFCWKLPTTGWTQAGSQRKAGGTNGAGMTNCLWQLLIMHGKVWDGRKLMLWDNSAPGQCPISHKSGELFVSLSPEDSTGWWWSPREAPRIIDITASREPVERSSGEPTPGDWEGRQRKGWAAMGTGWWRGAKGGWVTHSFFSNINSVFQFP